MPSGISQSYIDASMPALRAYGLAIIAAFYQRLFASHPELKSHFTPENQSISAPKPSPTTLYYAYTEKIETGAVLWRVIDSIMLQHSSAGMQDALYPVVGAHLMEAIKQVSADKPVPEILHTWLKAYGLFSMALIATEQALSSNTLALANQKAMG